MVDSPNPPPSNSLWDSVKKAAENVINLQIVTIVGDVQLSGSIRHPQVNFPTGGPSADNMVLATNINVVESDITSVIPEQYAAKPDNPVMKYHAEQVEQATAAMDQRVKMIKTLLTEILPSLRGEQSRQSQP